MYKISKDFSACYGHRVFTQSLNTDFCAKGDTKQKCRHLHGHEGKITVHLESDDVDCRGMVVDFKEIGWLKDFIDDIVDHKFIIARHDPMFDQLVTGVYEVACGVEPKFEPIFVDMCKVVGHSVNMDHVPADTSEYETLEGFTIVDFVPTSENLAKWIYDIVAAKMSQFNHVKVTCIEWSETPKSIARYYG